MTLLLLNFITRPNAARESVAMFHVTFRHSNDLTVAQQLSNEIYLTLDESLDKNIKEMIIEKAFLD